MVDMVPGANFIAINNNRARINVGYMGRSYDTMPIAAINMNGYIVDKRVSPNKNGGYTVNLKVKENNDIFNLSMVISPGGKCDVGNNAFTLNSPAVYPVEFGNRKFQ